MVTSRDVAALAGVSQATVSRVLAGSDSVRAATRDRVLAAMAETGYVPNLTARTMKTGRTGSVGVVVADVTNPFYPQLLGALSRAFADHRLTVWISDGPQNSAALQAVRERSVDGVIFTTVTDESAELRLALEQSSPIVLVNRTLPDVACDQVGSDNRAGGRLVADRLLAAGRRRVAVIGVGQEITTSGERVAGFTDRLAAAGVEPTHVVAERYAHDAGRSAMLDLLEGDAEVEAVFCTNDLLAFGALDAAHACGVQVPDDLWVIGYDDVEMAAWDRYSLTTVRQDVDELATAAADLLLTRLATPTAPTQRVALSPHLVLRSSAPLP